MQLPPLKTSQKEPINNGSKNVDYSTPSKLNKSLMNADLQTFHMVMSVNMLQEPEHYLDTNGQMFISYQMINEVD